MSILQVFDKTSKHSDHVDQTVESEAAPLEPDTHSRSKDEALKHPLGVKPSGNALTSAKNLQTSMGAFGRLPDAMILLLLEFLNEDSLLNVGATCRGLFAFSVYDQLWRDITIAEPRSEFQWHGSWRSSRRQLASATLPAVDCSFLFSDALYRPFQCAQIPLKAFVMAVPKQNQITRLSDLSQAEFSEAWTDRPFILTEPVKRWKVFSDWTAESLLARFSTTSFRAEAVDWPLATYVEYMNSTGEESPLYLFDRAFVEKMRLEVGQDGDYEPPACFGEDLFMLLGDQRPDHRWLIIGPERSGSTFHKDPNATSAWNAVIRGSKYWIMFPNAVIPPGVYMSADQGEVTSPLSIAEWLLTFHDEARNTPGCIEGICGEGEVLHVPSGWWHLVVNLEHAIAITQNFVPTAHLRAATNFLKNKPDQVSGFRDDVTDPYGLFMSRLEVVYPDLHVGLKAQMDRKRKWEDVIGDSKDKDVVNGGFSFGFGSDIDNEDEDVYANADVL